jgi:gluconate 2-dehydrogenase gamma chain
MPATVLAELRQQNANHSLPDWANEPEWQTIAQVQEILFPAGEDIPGAADIGASIYLHKAIENPNADGEDKDFIFRGVGWLNDLTQERHQKTFLQLTLPQQEKIIDVIVQSRAGRNWVSLLLTYILEALLAAPVYGGNRNGIGWQWLDYQPGFPMPPTDKTWDRLLQRRSV